MYAIFIETLLITVATRLGSDASADVMEAWVHLFAYVLKYMIPPAIKGHVDMKETYLKAATFKNAYQDAEEGEQPKRNRSFLWGRDDENDPERHPSFLLAAATAFRTSFKGLAGGTNASNSAAPSNATTRAPGINITVSAAHLSALDGPPHTAANDLSVPIHTTTAKEQPTSTGEPPNINIFQKNMRSLSGRAGGGGGSGWSTPVGASNKPNGKKGIR
jgi:hypothetical protein